MITIINIMYFLIECLIVESWLQVKTALWISMSASRARARRAPPAWMESTATPACARTGSRALTARSTSMIARSVPYFIYRIHRLIWSHYSVLSFNYSYLRYNVSRLTKKKKYLKWNIRALSHLMASSGGRYRCIVAVTDVKYILFHVTRLETRIMQTSRANRLKVIWFDATITLWIFPWTSN